MPPESRLDEVLRALATAPPSAAAAPGQVTIVAPMPAGYVHAGAFAEVAETLLYGLRKLGYDAALTTDLADAKGRVFIVGAHLLPTNTALPADAIIYNTEHVTWHKSADPQHHEMLRRHEIWDYSAVNSRLLTEFLGTQVHHVALGYVPELTRIGPAALQDIDVLFYGSPNARRTRVLDQLREAGLKVEHLFGVYGKARDALIARARLVLSMHYYLPGMFEIARVSYLLANRKAVVVEMNTGEEIDADLWPGLIAAPYDELVRTCKFWLAADAARHKLEQKAFDVFAARDMAEILKQRVGAPEQQAAPAPPVIAVLTPAAAPEPEVPAYYAMLNQKLLAAIPAARKVLEVGCASGILGRRYKELHPGVCWHGVDIHETALAAAKQHLDRVWSADLDNDDFALDNDYDCVVAGDVLEHLKAPERLLAAVRDSTTADARLVCCLPNDAHASIVERMLVGDLSYDQAGLLDRTHLRRFTLSSLYKMLLDTGWLPDLVDQNVIPHPDGGFTAAIVRLAARLGASREFAERTLACYQMIVACQKTVWSDNRVAASLSAIIPVNNEVQFALNAARSPGLAEIGAAVVPCRNAASAADAFAAGRARATGEWLLFAHQDVYFPRNFGYALSAILAAAPQDAVIGFVGLGSQSREKLYAQTFRAGLAVDRAALLDWPEAEFAVSLDEFAVVLHRDSDLVIDANLGWHLWATDLALQTPHARIVRIPVFHNSLTSHTAPPAYYASGRKLLDKYLHIDGITTLCGAVS